MRKDTVKAGSKISVIIDERLARGIAQERERLAGEAGLRVSQSAAAAALMRRALEAAQETDHG